MKLTVDIQGLDAATETLVGRFSERRLNAAAATALTRTALDVKAAEVREMRRVFDRPTQYALGGVAVQSAQASKLYAEVYLKKDKGGGTPALNFLGPEVEGGSRRVKGFEKALQGIGALPPGYWVVPASGVQLDSFGNVSRAQIGSIVKQLRLAVQASGPSKAGANENKRRAAARKASGAYFVVKPGARTQLSPGIYLREYFVRGVVPIFIFVNRTTYRPRLDFERIARETADERLAGHMVDAIQAQVTRLAGGAS